jgi:hypothetical protein
MEQNIRYHVNGSPASVTALSQMNPLHTHTSYVRSIVLLPFCLSDFWQVPPPVPCVLHALLMSYCLMYHYITVWWRVQIIQLVTRLFSQPPAPSFLNIFLSTLFWDALSLECVQASQNTVLFCLCYFLNARDKVTHLYKTIGKVIVPVCLHLYISSQTADCGIKCFELNDNKRCLN